MTPEQFQSIKNVGLFLLVVGVFGPLLVLCGCPDHNHRSALDAPPALSPPAPHGNSTHTQRTGDREDRLGWWGDKLIIAAIVVLGAGVFGLCSTKLVGLGWGGSLIAAAAAVIISALVVTELIRIAATIALIVQWCLIGATLLAAAALLYLLVMRLQHGDWRHFWQQHKWGDALKTS